MANPNPPVTPNASKLHYLLYDNVGTSAAAVWHSIKEITVNTETVGVAHVGTHPAGGTLGATDAVVVAAGADGTTIRAIAVNADGDIGIHDGGNSITVDGTVTANLGTIAGVATQTTLASVLTGLQDITYLNNASVVVTNDPGVLVLGVDILSGITFPLQLNSGNLAVRDVLTIDYNAAYGTTQGRAIAAIRNDAGAATVAATDGDAGPIAIDSKGRLGISSLGGSISIDDNGGTITVDASVGTPVNVQIGDGSNTATIRNLASNDALNVAIVDSSGAHITTFGGGTQYTEGTTQASIIGTALLWEDTSDVVRAVSAAKPLPVAIITGGGSGGTASTDDSAFTAGSGSGTPMMGFATSDLVDSGDVGVVGMTTARGMYTNIRDDAGDSCMDGANNALRVNIVAGAGAGGTALTDESTFTEASTSFTPVGGVFNDAFASDPSAGQAAAARITSDRALHVNLRGATGTELGTSGNPVRVDPTGTTPQPASQSGTWNITNISGTVSLPTGAATAANQSTEITALQLLDDVVATDGAAVLTKLYQVGGTDGTNAQIMSVNASGHVNIADGGNSITVDNGGTFAVQAAQTGTWNVTNVSGTVSLPTGAATSANQSTEITALQLLDDVVATDGSAALTKLYQVGGTDGTNAQIISVDSSGRVNVNIVSGPSGGTSSTDDSAFTVGSGFGTPLMGLVDETTPDSADEGDVAVARMTADRKLLMRLVGATDSNRLDVDASGRLTANLAAGTNNIGDVDVLTIPAPLSTTGNGTAATALRVTVASDSTGQVTANAGTGAFACNVGIESTAVSVGSSATALPASALASRRRIVIQNLDPTENLFVGKSGVTTSNGMLVFPMFAQAFEAGPGIGLFGITTGATINVRVLELS